MRLIDADSLKEDLTRFYDGEVTARQLIDEQPTVEPERKKGNWVGIDDVFECDQCGAIYYDTENSTWNLPNYCPSCGADMRGDEND